MQGDFRLALSDYRRAASLFPAWLDEILMRIHEIEAKLAATPQPPPTVADKTLPNQWPSWKPPPVDMLTPKSGDELDGRAVFRDVAPSVYTVVAGKSAEAIQNKGDISYGSAVAVTPQLAITNCHVLVGSGFIALYKNDEGFEATVWAADEEHDRCILKANGALRALHHGRPSRVVEVGEIAYTIGNPKAQAVTLADGIVSGIRVIDGVSYIQTTAPISPGSSGGALVDSKGNLIGITTFMLQDAQNVNFAIALENFWGPAATGAPDSQVHLPEANRKPDVPGPWFEKPGAAAATPARVTSVLYNRTGRPAVAPLGLDAAPGSDYYVKLVDPVSNLDLVGIYLKGGQKADIRVPVGSYIIRYASGTGWLGHERLFDSDTYYAAFVRRYLFVKGSVGSSSTYSGYSLKLARQILADGGATGIDASKF
jgi:hypothetical protein